jgi:hypothetical protein
MKIVFFGVGAVCSVMATLLDELSNKSKQKDINFVFVVRNIKKAQGHFFSRPIPASVFMSYLGNYLDKTNTK